MELGQQEKLTPEDRKATERSNRMALVHLLRMTGETTVELYGVWDGDFSEVPKAKETISLEQILDGNFYFKEQGFYTVDVSGSENPFELTLNLNSERR